VLTRSATILDRHTRLARHETVASLLAALSAAAVCRHTITIPEVEYHVINGASILLADTCTNLDPKSASR
jgi:hypothetical protein